MIRNAEKSDLETILKIYEAGREYMRTHGNPNQWKDLFPELSAIEEDLEKRRNYLVIHEDKIVGVFAFILGEDPTYKLIEGEWKNERPYGTIHRIASIGQGVFDEALEFCFKKCDTIRIDTHEDNATMRHLITSRGFDYCGIIYCHDGTPRRAYLRTIETK